MPSIPNAAFDLFFTILGRKWSAPAALAWLAICLIPLHPNMLIAHIATATLVGTCVIREDNGLAHILTLRPIAFIGVLSYGMYLFNSLFINVVLRVLGWVGLNHPLFIFPIAMGLTTAAAYFSYQYFETPFLQLKSRFSNKRSASSPQSVGAVPELTTNLPVAS